MYPTVEKHIFITYNITYIQTYNKIGCICQQYTITSVCKLLVGHNNSPLSLLALQELRCFLKTSQCHLIGNQRTRLPVEWCVL